MRQGARNAARWLIAGVAGGLGLAERHAARRRLGRRWGIILGYHRVIPPDERISPYRMGMGADLFDAQMRWLGAHHHVVSLEELIWWLSSGRTPPHDLVVLTFDDGYRDNLTHAARLLKQLGLPATFYVTSSALTERMPYWPEALARMIVLSERKSVTARIDRGEEGTRPITLPISSPAEKTNTCLRLIAAWRTLPMEQTAARVRELAEHLGVDLARAREGTPRLLAAEDLRALSSDGFTIGSHSANHPYLPAESEEAQRREIEDSKRILEEAIRSPVPDFCYPGGGHDERTRAIARAAGYRSAVTWDAGVAGPEDDLFALPRKGVGPALASDPWGRFSPAMMEGEITGCISGLIRRGTPPRP